MFSYGVTIDLDNSTRDDNNHIKDTFRRLLCSYGVNIDPDDITLGDNNHISDTFRRLLCSRTESILIQMIVHGAMIIIQTIPPYASCVLVRSHY